jgi:1-deoxy-D-xylulose-5-phosphate reductoisomerase
MGADWVMSAIVGAAGLAPTLAAARTGAVIAWPTRKAWSAPARRCCAPPGAGGTVIPVDSEHSAIFQVLQPGLPGPGGAPDPDRLGRPVPHLGPRADGAGHAGTGGRPSQLVMGAKISVDSATMMNKGLEMIEASYLFDTPAGAHRRRDPSAVRDPQPGRIRRRLDPGSAGAAGHARPIACAFSWPQRLPGRPSGWTWPPMAS